MAVLPILKWPDPRLGEVCEPVGKGADLRALVWDMFDTMYEAPGRGLAAPQVGVMTRVFVTDTTWKDGDRSPMVFVNPRILARSEAFETFDEGCLSIPGISLPVSRPSWVRLHWSDAGGDLHQARFDGFAAACVQHELDHLDGIVTLDHLSDTARHEAEQRFGALAP